MPHHHTVPTAHDLCRDKQDIGVVHRPPAQRQHCRAIQYRHLDVQTFEGYAGTSKAGCRAEAQQEALLARGEGLSLMVDRHEHEQLRGPSQRRPASAWTSSATASASSARPPTTTRWPSSWHETTHGSTPAASSPAQTDEGKNRLHAGIRYLSEIDMSWECWAVFEDALWAQEAVRKFRRSAFGGRSRPSGRKRRSRRASKRCSRRGPRGGARAGRRGDRRVRRCTGTARSVNR